MNEPLILAGALFAALLFGGALLLRAGRGQAAGAAALDGRLDALAGALTRLEGQLQAIASGQEGRLNILAQSLCLEQERLRGAIDEKLFQSVQEARAGRGELSRAHAEFEEKLGQRLGRFETGLTARQESLERRLAAGIEENAERLRATLNERLAAIQADNAARLEAMRKTVDEQLQATLEQRLGQSFRLVSERLEQVHRGLGEMQTLAAGVGDLKRVLGNVKTRGGWGEIQLGALIEQLLTPAQYARNVATRPDGNERVEFAIRLPGRESDAPVWLPIDAKFPLEDYQRLLDAHERADGAEAEAAARALEARLRAEARAIRDKYVAPPHTTDFAILYLPTEGLYAEALRRPGLAEALQREFRVTLSGPSTLAALLNSLQMGFRTLAIERRSSEVWALLGAVKTEFGKFGEVIAATQQKLEQATRQFGQVGVRQRAIARRLREVEALPEADGGRLLALPETDPAEEAGA